MSQSPDPAQLQHCTPQERDAARVALVLAKGFADDPIMNWMLGSSKAQHRMFYLLARHVYLPRGGGALWHEQDQDKAASLWLPPEQSKDLTLWPMMQLVASVVGHGGVGAALRTLKLDQYLEHKHPKVPHTYLFAVAVDPRFQGQGLGKRVLAPMLRHCDDHGLLAYLENSKLRNLPFYRGLGFEVVEEITIGKDDLPMWRMERAPR